MRTSGVRERRRLFILLVLLILEAQVSLLEPYYGECHESWSANLARHSTVRTGVTVWHRHWERSVDQEMPEIITRIQGEHTHSWSASTTTWRRLVADLTDEARLEEEQLMAGLQVGERVSTAHRGGMRHWLQPLPLPCRSRVRVLVGSMFGLQGTSLGWAGVGGSALGGWQWECGRAEWAVLWCSQHGIGDETRHGCLRQILGVGTAQHNDGSSSVTRTSEREAAVAVAGLVRRRESELHHHQPTHMT